MATNFSENEKEFFNRIITQFDVRMDGREKLEVRDFQIFEDVIPSCFSSLKLKLTNYDKDILITIKGELQKEKDLNTENNESENHSIFLSIDSINKIEDMKLKVNIEETLRNLILEKLEKNLFCLRDNKGDLTNYSWRLFIDILVFDSIKITYLHPICFGIKKALVNLKLPNLVFFRNEITGAIEFDLAENYEGENSAMAKDINIDFENKIPDMFVFSVINNEAYLDPSDEEEVNSDSIIVLTKLNGEIENVESIGSSVELQKIFEISNKIKNLDI